MTRTASLLALACLATLCGCDSRPKPPPVAVVAAPAPRPKPTYEADVAPTIDRHCLGCHDSDSGSGGVVLEGPDLGTGVWGRVADALRSGTMPPIGREQPSAEASAALLGWLDAEVFRGAGPDADPGRVTMRRLNRPEFDNTIRDLIGLDLHPSAAFPADDVGDGFDNDGDVLSIPPILMEKYLKAADLVLAEAARSPSAWSRIMNPAPDAIPLALRKPTFAARNEPIKRIGRPAPPAPPVAEDPTVLTLRRAREVLRGFADRAFRRPSTAEELDRLVGLVESALKEGDDFDSAIRHALKAVLISPNFLFHVEEEPEGPSAGGVRPLGEFELAGRLSYLLWSSLPDDELYRLAARGELGRGDRLSGEARRMLREGKAGALVDGFVAQWLQVRALGGATPDPGLFPGFDEPLRRSMVEETRRFAENLIREDRSVYEFLDADYTFVDERLARHYGIGGVVGDEFRRVSLAGTGRGGILTHASVLTITSNPTRTSPVKRGKWVLDVLLGMPPAPPPGGVEGLKAEPRDHETFRQAMERHRADPSCASCHARMDPIGFGLEGFDAIGARRSGEALDVRGSLPGLGAFEGPSGLRAALVARRDPFARCLAGKMLTYALGRGLGPGDRCAVDSIAGKLLRGDGRFSDLIAAVVESPQFRNHPPSKDAP